MSYFEEEGKKVLLNDLKGISDAPASGYDTEYYLRIEIDNLKETNKMFQIGFGIAVALNMITLLIWYFTSLR